MKKEFVPFEQSLDLEELEFDEPCFGYYKTIDKKQILFLSEVNKNIALEHGVIYKLKAPLFQQAFRWFREKYKLSCSVELTDNSINYYFDFTIYDSKNRDYNDEDCFDSCKRIYDDRKFDTYEEAELECLKQLIRNVKN